MNILNNDILNHLIIHLGSVCFVCDKKYPDNKPWTIHHRIYRKNEKSSKDFKIKEPHIITRGKRKGTKTIRTIYKRDEYYQYIQKIVLNRPEDFVPLHNSCHNAVTRLSRWKKPNLIRLYKLALEQK